MKFKHKKLSSVADWVIEDLRKHDGSGGLIALDGRGNGGCLHLLHFTIWKLLELGRAVALPLNSSGMFRGVIRADGQPKTAIFDDDVLT
jgi:L-asparaginase / beta-aspartyl-peptidase